jgi:hypothetical protein
MICSLQKLMAARIDCLIHAKQAQAAGPTDIRSKHDFQRQWEWQYDVEI